MLQSTWNKLPKHEHDFWDAESRKHDERWPYIKDSITESLQSNGSKGFRQVEHDIDGWCSHATISKWIKQHESYAIYTEHILPLQTTDQKTKQHLFSWHLTNHWGLPQERRSKILWVHYDEKWFWGFVACNNSKMCEEIGLIQNYQFAYHKYFIKK